MAERDYTNLAQQRILRLIFALAGNEFHGLSNKELAALLETEPSNVVRDLYNAMKAGWVEQIAETQRYRLGPRPVQVFGAFTTELQRMRQKIEETGERYLRTPG